MSDHYPKCAPDVKCPHCNPKPICSEVTVVYYIVDDAAWRDGGNPLLYEHHGLKAHTVCAYDAFERLQKYRKALEAIAEHDSAFANDAEKMSNIARAALGHAAPTEPT